MGEIKNLKDFPAKDVDYTKCNGLVPAIVQDARNKTVMNPEALEKTMETGLVTFWSRTRQVLWTKGLHNGHRLIVESMYLDCDNDTILVKAVPHGNICHTGADTCFGEENPSEPVIVVPRD